MPDDPETGFVPPQITETLAYDEQLDINSDSLGLGTSNLRVSAQVSGVEISMLPFDHNL